LLGAFFDLRTLNLHLLTNILERPYNICNRVKIKYQG
jgi:hypothetical protein